MLSSNIQYVIFFSFCFSYIAPSQLPEEEKRLYEESSRECSLRYPLSTDEQNQLKRWEIPESRNVRCYLACTFKKIGMMNDEGKFLADNVIQKTLLVMADDPIVKQRTIDVTEACRYVNDEYLPDDYEGCDRAALIFKCSAVQAERWTQKY